MEFLIAFVLVVGGVVFYSYERHKSDIAAEEAQAEDVIKETPNNADECIARCMDKDQSQLYCQNLCRGCDESTEDCD